MTVQGLRFAVGDASVPAVRQAITRLFAAVAEAAPAGLSYTAYEVTDTGQFALLLELEEGVGDPLPDIPEAAAFRQSIATWNGGPVPPQVLDVLGRYPA